MCKENPCIVGHCLNTTHADFLAGRLNLDEPDRKSLDWRIFGNETCVCPDTHNGKKCEKRKIDLKNFPILLFCRMRKATSLHV